MSILSLAANKLQSIDHDAPIDIRVRRGSIWVTQESDVVDYILTAPNVHTFRHPGRLVIEAIGDAVLEISPVAESRLSAAAASSVRNADTNGGETTIVEADLARGDHRAAVLALTQAYASDPMGNGRPLPEHVLENLIPRLRAHPTTRIWLAFVDDKPAGIATCFDGFSTFHAQPLINVHDVVVLPQHRGIGVGQALLGAVEARARALGCCKVTLEVLENNYSARRLYERAGFGQAVYAKAAGGALFYAKLLVVSERE